MIHISREIQCLPYAGFILNYFLDFMTVYVSYFLHYPVTVLYLNIHCSVTVSLSKHLHCFFYCFESVSVSYCLNCSFSN